MIYYVGMDYYRLHREGTWVISKNRQTAWTRNMAIWFMLIFCMMQSVIASAGVAADITTPGQTSIPIQYFNAQEIAQLAATPEERLAAQEAAQKAKSTGWKDNSGNILWPKNDGFTGAPKEVTLQPGAKIDRYGYEGGSYVAPEGTPYGMRALAPGTETKPYHVYEVLKPLDAMGGETAPWFDQPGGGLQFKFSKTIQQLLEEGYLQRVEP